ncbi:hypothetical protein BD408DRAFT_480917 [Parasitella parasitica]|nr:hypothetical protein BD408DRAFT_480917 [Parasitella parasitica]
MKCFCRRINHISSCKLHAKPIWYRADYKAFFFLYFFFSSKIKKSTEYRMPQSILLFLAAILLTASTASAEIAARANSCCGLMSGKIYCYGGLIFTGTTETKADSTLLMLDITKNSDAPSNDLQDMWKVVFFDKNDVEMSPRTDPQCLVVSEQNRMYINGGYDAVVGHRLDTLNIIYNAAQNRWFFNVNYGEFYFGERQIYYGSASYVPGKGAAFYGGYEEYGNPRWTLENTSVNAFFFAKNKTRTIGYPSVTYFNVEVMLKGSSGHIDPKGPWDSPPLSADAIDQFSAKHQSVFDPATKMLLFMGGEYRKSKPPSHTPILRPYNRIKAFNTETNVWSFVNLTGDLPAPGRFYSTLTLLPSTKRHVLLYGGELNNKVALDYCFVLDLESKKWTKQTISAPNGTILSRSRHSAVPVGNNTVYIMWGIDSSNVGTRSILALNTTNPYAITLSNKQTEEVTEIFVAKNVESGISTGVKAGLAVAGVAALALGALVVWLCIHYKKKNRTMREQERQITEQQKKSEYHESTESEPIYVGWDEIENKHIEGTAYTKVDIGANSSNETSTTLGGRVETPSVAEAIPPDGIDTHQPNTIDLLQSPAVLKPDGGY